MRALISPRPVSMTPDKKSLYITIAISEGERYQVTGTTVTGDLVQHNEEVNALAKALEGKTYSGAAITGMESNIKSCLANMVTPGRR